jgi:hypothetical protein
MTWDAAGGFCPALADNAGGMPRHQLKPPAANSEQFNHAMIYYYKPLNNPTTSTWIQ